jgi:hypothetical protein
VIDTVGWGIERQHSFPCEKTGIWTIVPINGHFSRIGVFEERSVQWVSHTWHKWRRNLLFQDGNPIQALKKGVLPKSLNLLYIESEQRGERTNIIARNQY